MRLRMRIGSLLAVVALGLASCGEPEPADVLVVDAGRGLARLDTRDGAITRFARGSITSPDGAVVVETMPAGGVMTDVRAVDVASGRDLWSVTVEAEVEPRVASPDAEWVALGPPRRTAGPDGYPTGRRRTPLIVVGRDGRVERHDLRGNVEPEAFALDGSALFVVDYQPAEAPTHYQVRRLDLITGDVGDVHGVDAELQRSM